MMETFLLEILQMKRSLSWPYKGCILEYKNNSKVFMRRVIWCDYRKKELQIYESENNDLAKKQEYEDDS